MPPSSISGLESGASTPGGWQGMCKKDYLIGLARTLQKVKKGGTVGIAFEDGLLCVSPAGHTIVSVLELDA
jgi:hypothetical protein